MNLAEIKARREAEQTRMRGSTVLVWGPPRTGKTRWVSSIAKAPQIKKIFFWDTENGFESIIHATNTDGTPYLSEEELTKINLIPILDTPERPLAAETLLKAFSSTSRTIYVNSADGKVRAKGQETDTDVCISPEDWGPDTAHVIDTIGQLGVSVLNLARLEMGDVKDQRRWYQFANQHLNNFFTMVQASNAYIICVTHVLTDEVVLARDKSGNPTSTRDDYYPLCLSKNYAMNVAKYFGSVIYRYIDGFSFAHVSTPTKKRGIQAGTRTNIDISSLPDATLPEVLKLVELAQAKPVVNPLLKGTS